VHAGRYAEAIAFDVSAAIDVSGSPCAPSTGLLTIRDPDAAGALRRWNATVPR